MTKTIGLGVMVILMFSGVARAGETVKLKDDVIEGRRMRPKIFLEFESYSPTMDSIIYKRSDFNDFHLIDMKLRLKYSPQVNMK